MPKKKTNNIDSTDESILDFLKRAQSPCIVQEIADGTGIDWMVIKNRLIKLKGLNFVLSSERPNNKTLWKFNIIEYNRLRALAERKAKSKQNSL